MDLSQVPTLETERLWLRLFRENDIDAYAAMIADPEVTHFTGGPWDRGWSWRHLAFLIGHWKLRGAGMWALEHKGTGAFVGMVGFSEPEGWPGFELAGKLARRWWGQGYASEGARAAMDYAFTVWKDDRIISLVNPENQASIRVVERIGERLHGRIQHLGKEVLCYGLDRETYLREVAPASLLALHASPQAHQTEPRHARRFAL
jgi:RimJ/RimL family protein N-acetyltransferase